MSSIPVAGQPSYTRSGVLWLTFAGVHLLFFGLLSPLIFTGEVLSDIQFYRQWAFEGLQDGQWQGISTDWVYPIGALAPMLLAAVFGYGPYQFAWFLIFTGLNAAAFAVLTAGRTRVRCIAAYWWLGITALLGPVAIGRIDGLTAPLVIMGLLWLATRPVIASLLLSAATWIKVWPAAVILAVLAVSKQRRTLLATGAAFSAAVAAVVAAAGGLPHLLSFMGAQGDRGMQLEAPFTTPGLWQAILGRSDAHIYEDTVINTREVRGALGEPVAALMTPLLALAAVAVVLLLVWAVKRGADAGALLAAGSLALVSAFIVFNKVGSPQFMLWLGAVVAVGVAWEGRAWRLPASMMIAVAALTTLVYPVFYEALYNDLNVAVAVLLTLRNLLLMALLAWSLGKITALARAGKISESEVRPEPAP
ncbi:glycosyltransferase family 87 protein [Arthrobacter koreensis]|uniref:glycosyltransferase family 87 protein n=1 Tax=Arthrobacter koreensis TaxID=199136 RepID=UPI0036DCE20A